MLTARDLADRVRTARRAAWSKNDPTPAIVMLDHLGAEDTAAVRRAVSEAGIEGDEFEPMVRHVSNLLVGQVAALDDDLPATGGD